MSVCASEHSACRDGGGRKAGLRIICAPNFREVQVACDAVVAGLTAAGIPCARIFPTSDRARLARRRLADAGAAAGGPSGFPTLGIAATTLPAWAEERWTLFGDGRRLVSPGQRRVFVCRAIGEASQAPRSDSAGHALDLSAPGLVGCVESLVRTAAGTTWLEDPATPLPEALSDAERELVGLARSYLTLLSGAGLVEPGTAAGLLPRFMGQTSWEHLVLESIGELPPALQDLLTCAAARAGATLVVHADASAVRTACEATRAAFESALDEAVADNPACACSVRLAANLAHRCTEAGSPVSIEASAEGPNDGGSRPGELVELGRRLFRASAPGGSPLVSEGAVRFLLPAGRYAEPEALAREVIRLRDERGIDPGDIVLACKDPLATAAALAGRLAGVGISCWARGSVPLALTQAGRALVGLARLVDAEQPPAEDPVERAKQARPDLRPVASDLALNPLLGINSSYGGAPGEHRQNARQLDRRWRQLRTTSACDLLDDLAEASPDVARPAIEAARAGDLAVAARALHQGGPHGSPDDAWLCESAALKLARGLLEAAIQAGDASEGEGGSTSRADEIARLFQGARVPCARLYAPCSERADAAEKAADGVEAPDVPTEAPQEEELVPSCLPPTAACDSASLLRIVRLGEVEPLRTRAVIVADLTADAYPLSSRDDAVTRLLDALGAGPVATPADRLRFEFAGAVGSAGELLVLERRLNDVDAAPLRPCALFEDVVDCYRPDVTDLDDLDKGTGLPRNGALPCDGAPGEDAYDRLLEPAGAQPAKPVSFGVPELLTSTAISGEPLLPDDPKLGEPALSPTSLELYLSCPARWYFERRLSCLEGIDAGFDARTAGTFCHAVLQRVHERMLGEGMPRITLSTPEEKLLEVDRLVEECFDELRPEFARGALDRSWARDLRPQGSRKPQDCLVATNESEGRSFASYLRQLKECVRRDAWIPMGFSPKLFEWSLGDPEAVRPVYYAGVRLKGIIDRVDVDGQGNALVIDYKGGLSDGHELPRPKKGEDELPEGTDPLLPQHSQALMYATALLRGGADEGLVPQGALYLSYSKDAIKGFADPAAFGPGGAALLPEKNATLTQGALVRPEPDGSSGFLALLAHVEDVASEAIDRLRDGDIAPRPRFGKESCQYCPVTICPRRVK